jgi:hypothetical protein
MAQANDDPVFAAIDEHKRLRSFAYDGFGEHDEGPEYEAACVEEESALQALSRLKPINGGRCSRSAQVYGQSRRLFRSQHRFTAFEEGFDCRQCAEDY